MIDGISGIIKDTCKFFHADNSHGLGNSFNTRHDAFDQAYIAPNIPECMLLSLISQLHLKFLLRTHCFFFFSEIEIRGRRARIVWRLK